MNCSAFSCERASGPALALCTCGRLLTPQQTPYILMIQLPNFTCFFSSDRKHPAKLTRYQQEGGRSCYGRVPSLPSHTRAGEELRDQSGPCQEGFRQPPPAARRSHSKSPQCTPTLQHLSTLHHFCLRFDTVITISVANIPQKHAIHGSS